MVVKGLVEDVINLSLVNNNKTDSDDINDSKKVEEIVLCGAFDPKMYCKNRKVVKSLIG